ncbi:ATP-binding protein [Aquabacterium humicola]|uniref:ATP-binding protein n=1 Tax=Aquabacterium humicola TaxID=3237377 RepID=UPI00254344B0|nr:AAA family ATPase [Rubrivivax pictus]
MVSPPQDAPPTAAGGAPALPAAGGAPALPAAGGAAALPAGRGDAPLQVRLLGDLQLRRGDVALALPASRRTRALLGYLVATGTPQSRSALCDLLWDGPEDPRGALRWSLTKLRPLVDHGPLQRLVADRERVGFEARDCDIDTVRIDALFAGGLAAADLAALEQAATLLKGEFLDGLDLPACYRFHHWCLAERERHGRQRRAVLQALVERLAATPARALPHAHAMVAAEPLDEAAHAALVTLLAADGRYPDAERQHEWARALLRREGALAADGPLDEAIRRARQARRDVAPPPAEPAAATGAAPAAVEACPPTAEAAAAAAADAAADAAAPPRAALIGRADECRLIAEALADPRPGPLLLITGEPGLGKTRLLDQLADAALAAGRRVIRGRCFEAEMARPYGLWLDALRSLPTAGLDAATVEQAAPLLAGRAAIDGNREQLFGAAAALVAQLARLKPLALLFDDLQWIDEGSAALLHYVARSLQDERAAATPVLLAAAARPGELEDNPWCKGLVQSLARSRALRRLPLAPLADAEARLLIEAAPLEAGEALQLAGGNPLYLLELARAARRGRDARDTGIDALVDERLQALDAPSRELLGWAAAMGGELRPDLLAAAAGLPVAELLSRLDRLAQRGLLADSGDERFHFVHDIVRQQVMRGLSQPRRQSMHRQCAQVLAAAAERDPSLHGEVVRHALQARDALGAARASIAAGEHCLRVFANGPAGTVAERGLACIDELLPGPERVELEIALLRLRVAAAAGPGGRRLPALAARIESAIAAAEALGLHAQAAAGWEILAFWRQQASDPAHAQQASLAAQQRARRADAETRCRQLANSGRCLLDIEADPVRGRALLAEAGQLADELDLTLMELHWGRGLEHRAQGALDDARSSLERAVELARLTGIHWREVECLVWLATIELESGAQDAVLARVGQIIAAAARMGETDAPFAQALAALARLQRGDAAAAPSLDDALCALRTLDDKAHLAYALNEAALLDLAGGRREQAAARAAEALAAAQAVRRPTEVAVALATLAAASGDAAQAAAWRAQLPQDEAPTARAAAALDRARAAAASASTAVAAPPARTTRRRPPCPESSSNAASTPPSPTRT